MAKARLALGDFGNTAHKDYSGNLVDWKSSVKKLYEPEFTFKLVCCRRGEPGSCYSKCHKVYLKALSKLYNKEILI